MLLERLMRQSGLTASQIERYAATASLRYRVYQIPKRTAGVRVIAQPSPPLKALQRWISSVALRALPVHDSATAYKPGASIRENALRHRSTNFTLRLDFENFFPSFSGDQVASFLKARRGIDALDLSEADISFVRRIVCRHDALAIGAPSSPSLTNVMMCDFDEQLTTDCGRNGLIYTRYADDIFISSQWPNCLDELPAHVSELARAYSYASLRLNAAKTAFLSRKYRRSVTGIIVTPTGELSIGLERKRAIKTDLYRFRLGTLPTDDAARLRGMVAFVRDVEPSFFATLQRKYGADTLAALSFSKVAAKLPVEFH